MACNLIFDDEWAFFEGFIRAVSTIVSRDMV